MPRILYVVSRFPSPSATFTADEIDAVRDAVRDAVGDDAQVAIAAVWGGAGAVIRLPLAHPVTWLHALAALVRRPAVIGLIVRALAAHIITPYAALRGLAGTVKGLALGWRARRLGCTRLHAHFLTTPALVAMIAAAAADIPYSVTIHAFDIFATSPRLRNAAIPLKCGRASACIVISEFNRAYMRDHWPGLPFERFHVVYNGIDLAAFEARPADTRAAGGAFHIVTVGRLVPKKGIDTVIRAAARLAADGVPVTLTITGDGPQRAELETLVADLSLSDRVRFTGWLPPESVRVQVRGADVFALAPMRAPDGDMDGLPTVLIEALALRVPVVAARTSGVPELVHDGETGLLVPPADPTALAAALGRIHADPALGNRLAAAGRRLVEDRFDRAVSARRLLAIWGIMEA